MRKHRKSSPKTFMDACRAYSRCVKAKKKLAFESGVHSQERSFKSNPWHFAKKIYQGNATKEQEPTFNAELALSYFQVVCTDDKKYSELPPWVSRVMPPPDDDSLLSFNMSAITPGQIKCLLKNQSSSSSPGDDGITYHHLKKMPLTHNYLAK